MSTPVGDKKESKKAGLRDPDMQQKLLNYIHFLVDMYKSVMTSMLCLFIPQRCSPVPRCPTVENDYWGEFTKNPGFDCLKLCSFIKDDGTSAIFGYNNNATGPIVGQLNPAGCASDAATLQMSREHTCGMVENIQQLGGFGIFVFVWNFITLFVIVAHYYVMLRRENWLVEYLDEDDNLPDNYLEKVIDKYPSINEGLAQQNRYVFTSAFSALVVLIVNAIVSGMLVFRSTHNDGFRTATTYITNLLLMLLVLKTCAVNAWVGIQKRLALSCINFEPLSFNKIDTDHLDMKVAPSSSAPAPASAPAPGHPPTHA
jgi:hypothetical protein